MVILGVRSGTSHVMDAPGLPGCFPRLFFSARSAARRCLRGGFRPGRSSELGGIEEFPLFRDPARAAVFQLLPKAGDRRLQRGDLLRLRRDQLRLLPDQRITRIRGRLPGGRIAHSPQSSRKPRSPTTATPGPTLERNPRLLAARDRKRQHGSPG